MGIDWGTAKAVAAGVIIAGLVIGIVSAVLGRG